MKSQSKEIKLSEDIYKKLAKLEKSLGFEFKDKNLLVNALTHRSYLNEIPTFPLPHNERMEFLGDAVLELIISRYLYNKYPERPEGELTSFRSAIVKTKSLADASIELGYSDYILMSSGEENTGGRTREHILANTFEAVLGAIYLDQGFEAAEEFLQKVLLPKMEDIVRLRLDIDNKSKFQEVVQEILKVTPEYKLVEENGPDHDKTFTMGVFVNEKEMGRGAGRSKQEAEQNAATEALKKMEKYKLARMA
jgi:ribonuclease-3